jgi:hypothetical protein
LTTVSTRHARQCLRCRNSPLLARTAHSGAGTGLCGHPPEDRRSLGASGGDFLIQGPAQHGIPGLINLFGIESPGLTASLAIADYVAAVAKYGMPAENMRAVLDTNIVLDLLHFADPQTQALQPARSRAAPCAASPIAIACPNWKRVSAYPQFRLDAAAQAGQLLERYRSFTSSSDDSDEIEDYPLPRCRDSDDQKFLILALRCRADLLITRDRLLLRARPPPPSARPLRDRYDRGRQRAVCRRSSRATVC